MQNNDAIDFSAGSGASSQPVSQPSTSAPGVPSQRAPQPPRQSVPVFAPYGTSRMARMLMRASGGLIRSDRNASLVMIGFVVLASAISLYIVFVRGNSGEISGTSFSPLEGYGGKELPDHIR
jgi:hypothetical protein